MSSSQLDPPDPKAVLHRYLQAAREAILWKLDGLSDHDVRRPMTPSGTNLLGLVKHLASIELGYFGETFDRPSGDPLPWFDDDAEPDADMWATAEELRAGVIDLYHRAWAHADATIEALPLDAVGRVPHWRPERSTVSLHQILVHMIAETHRHAGHADIVREMIDGAVGMRPDSPNVGAGDAAARAAHVARLERVARQVSGQPPGLGDRSSPRGG